MFAALETENAAKLCSTTSCLPLTPQKRNNTKAMFVVSPQSAIKLQMVNETGPKMVIGQGKSAVNFFNLVFSFVPLLIDVSSPPL